MSIVLENVRIAYVNIFEPEENLSGDLAYGCEIRIEKDDKENLARVNAAIEKAIAKGKQTKWGGKKPKFQYDPLRDGDKEIEEGCEDKSLKGYFFKGASRPLKKGKPGIVDENVQPCMDDSKFYSGCYANVEVNLYPYKNGGNAGVGWGLNNIMFVEDGDRLDGQQSAQDAFQSLAPQTPEDDDIPF